MKIQRIAYLGPPWTPSSVFDPALVVPPPAAADDAE